MRSSQSLTGIPAIRLWISLRNQPSGGGRRWTTSADRPSPYMFQPNIKMESMFLEDLPYVPSAEVRYRPMAVAPGRLAITRMQTFAQVCVAAHSLLRVASQSDPQDPFGASVLPIHPIKVEPRSRCFHHPFQ